MKILEIANKLKPFNLSTDADIEHERSICALIDDMVGMADLGDRRAAALRLKEMLSMRRPEFINAVEAFHVGMAQRAA